MQGHGGSGRNPEAEAAALQAAVDRRMSRIQHKILVLSGKGGVGKSTVAANLAYALSLEGKRVGLLDVDVHGPSIPKMLGLEGRPVGSTEGALTPVAFSPSLGVMSMGFFFRDRDEALIWRGPLKANLIRQFLSDVEWGDLDYLIIDSPPGTGDEPLSVGQLVPGADGALVVTTPQAIAVADVRKSINFCRKLGLPVLGVIENMSGLVCPHCGKTVDVFKTGGGEQMAREMGVPFMGRIPLDPRVVERGDRGELVAQEGDDGAAAESFMTLARTILGLGSAPEGREDAPSGSREGKTMRIAIPVAGGKLCPHFGHCEEFALIDADPEEREVLKEERIPAPEHQPGLLPRWLAEQGANVIIAGGMGSRAQALFQHQGIDVVTGVAAAEPAAIVQSYLDNTLEMGDNICDH